MNTASAGSIPAIGMRGEPCPNPVSLAGKKTGLSLVWMVSLGLIAASLAITGWLALLAYGVIVLVQKGVIDWVLALWIVALLNLAGASGIAYLLIQRSTFFLVKPVRRLTFRGPFRSGYECRRTEPGNQEG